MENVIETSYPKPKPARVSMEVSMGSVKRDATLTRRKFNPIYTVEEKITIVHLAYPEANWDFLEEYGLRSPRSGLVSHVCETYGVGNGTVSRWRKTLHDKGYLKPGAVQDTVITSRGHERFTLRAKSNQLSYFPKSVRDQLIHYFENVRSRGLPVTPLLMAREYARIYTEASTLKPETLRK